MNETAANTPAAEIGHELRTTDIPQSRVLATLIRREFWENRQLWIVPLVVAAIMLIASLFTHFGSASEVKMPFGPQNWNWATARPVSAYQESVALTSLRQWMLAIPLYIVAAVLVYFYLLNSLFDERKDRSILFWKSLPVSDGLTVASKLLVGTVIVPLGTFVIVLVTYVLYAEIWNLRVSWGLTNGPAFVWDAAAWFKLEGLMLIAVCSSMLWYAPVAAYLVFISSWARRQVFLWSVLPWLILGIVERIAFGTQLVQNLGLYRLGGPWGNPQAWNFVGAAIVGPNHNQLVDLSAVFDSLSLAALLGRSGLWIGLVVAAGFAYGATRIRRFRDDT